MGPALSAARQDAAAVTGLCVKASPGSARAKRYP